MQKKLSLVLCLLLIPTLVYAWGVALMGLPIGFSNVLTEYSITLAAGEIGGSNLLCDTTETVGPNLVTDSGFDVVTDDAGELATGLLTIGNCYLISLRTDGDFQAAGSPDDVAGTYFNATTTGVGLLDAGDKVFPVTFTNWTAGVGWAPQATAGALTGKAQKVAGTASALSQASVGTDGSAYRSFSTFTVSAGTVTPYIGAEQDSAITSSGNYIQNITSGASGQFAFWGGTTFAGTVDNATVRLVTNPKQNGITAEISRISNQCITSKTVAGVTTVLDVSPVDVFGSELVPNGQAWTGASGATPPTGWLVTIAGVFTAVADSGPDGVGDTCLKVEVNATPLANPIVDESVAVEIGKRYRFSAWFKKGTAATGRVRVGSARSLFDYLNVSAAADVAWTEYSAEFTATTTTCWIRLRTLSGTAGQDSLFDDVSLKEVPAKTLIALHDSANALWVFYDGTAIVSGTAVTDASIVNNKRHYAVGDGTGTFTAERLTLGALENSGACTLFQLYYIVANATADHFFVGCAAGDYFISDGTETPNATNTVKKVNP